MVHLFTVSYLENYFFVVAILLKDIVCGACTWCRLSGDLSGLRFQDLWNYTFIKDVVDGFQVEPLLFSPMIGT